MTMIDLVPAVLALGLVALAASGAEIWYSGKKRIDKCVGRKVSYEGITTPRRDYLEFFMLTGFMAVTMHPRDWEVFFVEMLVARALLYDKTLSTKEKQSLNALVFNGAQGDTQS